MFLCISFSEVKPHNLSENGRQKKKKIIRKCCQDPGNFIRQLKVCGYENKTSILVSK